MGSVSKSSGMLLMLAMLAAPAVAAQQEDTSGGDVMATVVGTLPSPEQMTRGPKVEGIISARSDGRMQVTTDEGFLQAKERVVALFEREAVARFLAEAKGNVSKAAIRAGITRRNFHRLISKYSIRRENMSIEK